VVTAPDASVDNANTCAAENAAVEKIDLRALLVVKFTLSPAVDQQIAFSK
jgi:hypothetical protein